MHFKHSTGVLGNYHHVGYGKSILFNLILYQILTSVSKHSAGVGALVSSDSLPPILFRQLWYPGLDVSQTH